MAEAHPAQIGRYKVLGEVGRGGFGRVYRGYDPTVGRPVAIKILTQVSEDTRSRFRNEAMVAGNLGHKNIVTVYEYGTHEDRPFLAMEYLEGKDLHDIIASRAPLSLLNKCNIMSQVADGLYCAHQGGVVHRDMKPGNIKVLRDGTVKIMDFGIARLTDTADATRLTQQGILIGTLRYMAPEQLAGSEFTAQCDIFAYGVIFYELLTGKHPFEARDAQSLMYKLSASDPQPIREVAPGIPAALERVINRLLQKSPKRRYENLKEVQFDTEPVRMDLQKARAQELLGEAQEHFNHRRFEAAQKPLHEALALEPGDRAARALWEQLQQQTMQPRADSYVRDADEHLAARRFDGAIETLEKALALDRSNSEIQGRLEKARASGEHARKASQLVAEARRELEQQNLTAAYRIVSEALRHDPKNPEAAEFLKTMQTYAGRRQSEERIDEMIRKAQGLLLIPAYDEAIALLTAQGSESDSPRVRELLERVRREKTAHERKQKLRGEMATATDLLRDHRLDEAAICLEALHAEFPEDQDVARLLAYAQKERASLARAKAIDTVAGEVRARLDSQDFEAALAMLDGALKEYPGESGLVRLLESTLEAKTAAEALRHACEQASRMLDQNRPEAAVETVQKALIDFPADPELNELLHRAQEAVRAREKARAIGSMLRDAARHTTLQDFDKALEILAQGLETWPEDADLARQREATLEAKQALEEQRARAEAIDTHAREAERLAGSGDFDQALALLEEGLRNWPEATSLERLRGNLLAERDRRQKRQRALEDLEEVSLLSLEAKNAADAAGLLSLAINVASQHPDDEEIQSVAAGPIALLSDIARASEELVDANFQASLEISRRCLEQYPGHPALVALQTEGESGQKRRALNDVHRRAAAEPDLRERTLMLEEALREYPDDSALAEELRLTRNKLALIESIVERARSSEQAAQWDEALEKWNSLHTIYSQYPGLDGEIERVQLARQKAQAGAVERRIQQIQQALDAGDLGKATDLLRQAQTEYPTAPALAPVSRRVQDLGEKRKRARELFAKAEAASESGNNDEHQTCLRQAFQMDESDAAFRQLVLNKLVDRAQSAIQTDWRQAEALVGEATALQPGFSAPGAVLRAIAEGRKEPVVSAPPDREPPPAAAPHKRPWRGAAIAASITLVAVTSVVMSRVLQRPAAITVTVTANVPGASVSLDASRCTIPSCAFELTPGTYTVRGTAAGYESLSKQLTLTRGQKAAVLDLSFQPSAPAAVKRPEAPPPELPPPGKEAKQKAVAAVPAPPPVRPAYLLIEGMLPGVQVKLDGQPLGDADRKGALRHEVPPGTHNLDLLKEEYTPLHLVQQFQPGRTTRLDRGQVAMSKAAKPALPPPPPDPKEIEAQEWNQIANSANPEDFDRFARTHAGGAHQEQARTRASELRQQAQASALRQAEQASWERVDKNNREQLQDYLSHFPAGAHAPEARGRIADLDRQAAEAATAQRERESKELEKAKTAADEAAIGKVLEALAAAYNRRDIASMQKVWPGVPAAAYRDQFRDAQELSFQLQPTGRPAISGNSATVTCARTTTYRGKSGGAETRRERVRVTLSREGPNWLIRSISVGQ
jgi:serine/threonine-protein kinase